MAPPLDALGATLVECQEAVISRPRQPLRNAPGSVGRQSRPREGCRWDPDSGRCRPPSSERFAAH